MILKKKFFCNSVVTDVLFLVCITSDAVQEVTCGLFRKISHVIVVSTFALELLRIIET